MSAIDQAIKAIIPVGRWLTPDDVARIVTPKMPKAMHAKEVRNAARRLGMSGQLATEIHDRRVIYMREN